MDDAVKQTFGSIEQSIMVHQREQWQALGKEKHLCRLHFK